MVAELLKIRCLISHFLVYILNMRPVLPDKRMDLLTFFVLQTRGDKGEIDAVGIVTILHKDTGPEILLQKQFRAPIGKVSIEIPAGLIDPGETGDTAAVRELHEETGYVGEIVKHEGDEIAEGVMFNDPGFTNTNTIIRHVKVDLSKEENLNPKPQLEDSEFIETFSVRLDDLAKECRRLEAQGYAIDARVGTIVEGYELRRKFGG